MSGIPSFGKFLLTSAVSEVAKTLARFDELQKAEAEQGEATDEKC